MSSYLAQRIEKTPNIEVLCSTRVSRMSGDRYLQSAEIVDMETSEVRTLETSALFSFIGAAEDRSAAEGNRDELPVVCSHRSGFDAVALDFAPAAVFAGDQPARRVRCGRCSIGFGQAGRFAVGEGAMAVQFVEEYLKEM